MSIIGPDTLLLAFLGMSTVFVFLILLIASVMLMSFLLRDTPAVASETDTDNAISDVIAISAFAKYHHDNPSTAHYE